MYSTHVDVAERFAREALEGALTQSAKVVEPVVSPANADGAFDTRKCYEALAARGAAAIIPPRENAKP